MGNLELPATVQGVLTNRIDRLPSGGQLTLKVASVIGPTFSGSMLHAVHPLAPGSAVVGEHLAMLAGQDFTHSTQPGTFAFKTAVARDVAYDLLLFPQRRDIHRAIAELLERDQSHDHLVAHYTSLAHHWNLAGVPQKAVGYLFSAGKASEQAFPYGDAVAFFREALECEEALKEQGDRDRRRSLHEFLGRALKGTGCQDEAEAHWPSAVGLARELGDRLAEGRILISIGDLHSIRNQNAEALAILQEAEAKTRETGDATEHLRCLLFLARLHNRLGNPNAAIDADQRALDFAEAAADDLDVSVHLAFLGHLHVTTNVPGMDAPTRIRRGVSCLEEAAAIQRLRFNKLDLYDTLNLLAGALWLQGRYHSARDHFEETRTLSTEAGTRFNEICAVLNIAKQHHGLGAYAEMEFEAREAQAESHALNYREYAIISQVLRAVAMAHRGRSAEALALHGEATDALLALSPDARQGLEGTLLPYIAERQLFFGESLEALASLDRAKAIISESGVREYQQQILILEGAASFASGDLDGASRAFGAARELGNAAGNTATAGRARLGLAHIAWRRGDRAVAQEELDLARIGAWESGSWVGEIALLAGDLALDRNDTAGATAEFDAALQWGQRADDFNLAAHAYFRRAFLNPGQAPIRWPVERRRRQADSSLRYGYLLPSTGIQADRPSIRQVPEALKSRG